MKRKYINLTIIYMVLIAGASFMIFPFLWMFSSAFKAYKDVFAYPPKFIAEHPTLATIKEVFLEHHFSTYMLNTAFVTITITLAALLFHSMAAYSLARLHFPGRHIIFLFTISTLMIPLYAILVPRYIIINQFGWVDSYAGLIIPAIPHAFGIFALRQFFIGIPKELEEAAKMDGCSKIRIYFTIVLPLSKGILVTLAVLFFMANWDSFIWPLISTTSESKRVIQVGIAGFVDQQSPQWHLVIAAAAMTSLPSIIVFLSLQRYIVEGIKTTGLKG
jgi:multiple sugar transport system permease protein